MSGCILRWGATAPSGPSFAADNAGFKALVLGDPLDTTDINALVLRLSTSRDGTEVAKGSPARTRPTRSPLRRT